ncbi:alpha/beta hydrolase [Alloyangia pacifica]|uniref:Predicted esterase n=1 Tax=Alloyangia pacifica TaxID=311180 RepID=A0A1I6SC57_9RHOB|nr:alpha/beta hydrolase [Alloyangia pacifica]SDG75706.1 Predicted esterase [Alloyangia pacifica]SFS74552.1 Predicted esterase [Alloyangia pacifica]
MPPRNLQNDPTPLFHHVLHQPEQPDGSALLLLHGTGGNETDLIPLGQALAPRSSLLGVRGRATDEGVIRWFRRLEMARFDQQSIRSEADAFADFLPELLRVKGIDPARLTVLGYSNGANFAAALMALHPGLLGRAVLLRPMLVLDEAPRVDLSGTRVLTVSGQADPYGRYAPALTDWLRRSGATLDVRALPTGHGLSQADLNVTAEWLGLHRA